MRLTAVFLALVALLGVPLARAQSVEKVFPLEPPDGGTAGPKPILQVGVEGTELGKMRFRIELSRDGWETVAHTFDQKEDPQGWVFTALGGESGAAYRVRQPLDNGLYEWRAWAWNGVDWVKGKTVHRLRIDGIPPADVGLRMRVDREKKAIVLDWDPVATDAEGGSETVVKYHVYRYARRSFFFVIRPFEIGTTETTSFEDASDEALSSTLLFYKVTAEDEAGNEPERRY